MSVENDSEKTHWRWAKGLIFVVALIVAKNWINYQDSNEITRESASRKIRDLTQKLNKKSE